ncbi:hypothetical protein FRC11_012210, partial [Ceratobasidium sp. 423]
EYDNLALPSLVAGCITLMSSVKPSPFYYEYGYLSFRLMVIGLTACLLKYGRYFFVTPEDTGNGSPIYYLKNLWERSAEIIGVEMQYDDETG